MKEKVLSPPINSAGPEIVSPLAREIADAPDLEARPDLILRLVDLLFLCADEKPAPPC